MKRRIISGIIIAALALLLAVSAGCSKPDRFSMNSARPDSNVMYESPYYAASSSPSGSASMSTAGGAMVPYGEEWRYVPMEDTEEYLTASESPFKDTRTSPLSTFSADVDTASYSNMRRLIKQGLAPVGVRIEELVNYFDYSYPAPLPDDDDPFSVIAEVSECPWAPDHLLAMIGVQGAKLQNSNDIANNIVFLIDVSGSMNEPNRLPLVKQSMKLLLEQLGENDIISIVTYAGSDKIVADSVSGSDGSKLARMIDNLSAGGSTAGARGIRTAYDLASKNFIKGGNNRIILATDGDFNVGISSVADLTKLIESERDRGIFISVLGFGMGNLKDDMMKSIASNGNGNYAYIDTLQEAKKVLVDEFDSTMFVIAKDVKLQVEFNPATVEAYRLIGYDTRRLENEDFNNDLKDAGDIGAGHNVTVFYELVPAGAAETEGPGSVSVDPLKYSAQITTNSDDFMTVKIRYKAPDGDDSILMEQVVGCDAIYEEISENFMFASAVAEFGLIVTDSYYKANSSLSAIINRAGDGMGDDVYGLRAEFLDLVRAYRDIID